MAGACGCRLVRRRSFGEDGSLGAGVCTEPIRGHVFCSLLALCLRKKLDEQLTTKGMDLERQDIICDLNELQEVKTVLNGKAFILRSQLKGCAHSILQTAGVAAPPIVREALQ